MVDEVRNVIEKWQSDERLTLLGEAKVQQVIVLPIFRRLGWDPDDDHEVYPQFPVADRWVDYALLIGNAPRVFIEVKKGGEPLEKHQEQLLDYSFKQGVKLAVLTNGTTWWFYLPLQEGSWEERKFHAAEFDKKNAAEIAQIFVNLLSKEDVSSGKAIENAEDLCKRHQIAEALPEAWEQLVNNKIPNLLAALAQELCGHKPSTNEVEQFLSAHLQQIQTTPHPAPDPPLEPNPSLGPSPSGSVTGKKPAAFTFSGSRYEVSSWKEMLVGLSERVREVHRDRFEEVLDMKGRKKRYFSRDSRDLQAPCKINGTDIYVETNFNANQIVQIAENLVTHFGYSQDDLSYKLS